MEKFELEKSMMRGKGSKGIQAGRLEWRKVEVNGERAEKRKMENS